MEFAEITTSQFDELKMLQKSYKSEIEEENPNQKDFASLYKAIENQDIHFYGCFIDERLVGCCSVCFTYSTFNYAKAGVFEDFYIMPEYRHQGIARKLVTFAYETSGVSSLTVGCADCDLAMYQSLGFGIPLGNMLAFEN